MRKNRGNLRRLWRRFWRKDPVQNLYVQRVLPPPGQSATFFVQINKGDTMIRIALILAVLGLSACETVKGAGRDITNAGQAVDNAL